MPLLAAFDCLATPAYKTLVVHDADADVSDSQAMERARHEVAASSGYQIYLWSFQDSARVRVRVHVWDELPRDDDQHWDGSATLSLTCESGLLLVTELAQDVPGQWQLPAAGRYQVRVRWRNRQEMLDRVNAVEATYFTGGDIDYEQLRARKAEFEGLEEYHLDMWQS